MDFTPESIETVFNLTARGVDTIGKLGDLLSRLKGAIKNSEGATDPNVEAAIGHLEQEIRYAQLQNELLEAKVSLAKHELTKLHEAQSKLALYEGYNTQAGGFVYRLKEGENSTQDAHFICPNCRHKGIFSALQGDNIYKSCREKDCGARFEFRNIEMPHRTNRAF